MEERILKELAELKQLAVMQNKEVLNVDDLALLTGLSKSHIYKLVWAKRIPYYKNEGGRLTFFKKKEIENWLCAHRVMTMAEAESKAILYCEKNRKGGGL